MFKVEVKNHTQLFNGARGYIVVVTHQIGNETLNRIVYYSNKEQIAKQQAAEWATFLGVK